MRFKTSSPAIFSKKYTSALSRNQIPHAPEPRLVHCLRSEHSLMLSRPIMVGMNSRNPTLFVSTLPLILNRRSSFSSCHHSHRHPLGSHYHRQPRQKSGKAAKVISRRQPAAAKSMIHLDSVIAGAENRFEVQQRFLPIHRACWPRQKDL